MRARIVMPWALAIALLSPGGCTYDYGSLKGRPGDTGLGETGGSTTGTGAHEGSGGAVGNTGGVSASSGGRPGGVGSGGGPATGGAGMGGVGGGPISSTGGAGDNASGGAGAEGGRGTGSGGVTGAATISIDFVGGMPMAAPATGTGGNGGSGAMTLIAAPAMTATEVAGVQPVANWNSAPGLTGTLNNLVQSDGSTSSASATWTVTPGENGPGVWKNRFTDTPGDIRMMNGYLDPVSNALPATVMVSNLPADMAAAGYDVYVYVSGDVPSGTRMYTYALGPSSVSVVQTGPTPATFSGFVPAPAGGMGNYIVFRKVTGAAFTLTARPPVGTITRAPLNGMQIVSPPGP